MTSQSRNSLSSAHETLASPVATATVTAAPAAAASGRRHARRLTFFIGVVSLVLLFSTLGTAATFRHFTGIRGWPLWLPLLFTLSFVPAVLLGFRYRHPLVSSLYRIAATSIALLNFAFIAALACWVVAGAALLFHPSLPLREITLALYALAAGATAWGIINALWLRTTRVTVALPNLPPAWQGRTLALLSDIHLGNIRGARLVRKIVARLDALQPDAVLIAGDMFDGAAVDLAAITQPWEKLNPPQGVYFSTGNHDEFSDRAKYLDALQRVGIRILDNEKVTLTGGLQLIGIHDGEAADPTRFRQLLQHAQIDRQHPSILIAHQPSHLTIPEEAGISLQVSGHTHQGQFWPWTHIVSRVHGRFAYGLQRLNSLQVLTSSGAGTWGPPIRVGTRSEIVLIRLESAPQNLASTP